MVFHSPNAYPCVKWNLPPQPYCGVRVTVTQQTHNLYDPGSIPGPATLRTKYGTPEKRFTVGVGNKPETLRVRVSQTQDPGRQYGARC